MGCSSELIDVLKHLCPMHIMLSRTGHIVAVGETLQKLRPDTALVGARFLEMFETIRPRSALSMADLLGTSRGQVKVAFRDAPRTTLKGVICPLSKSGGAIINLGFGLSILEAVDTYALTNQDFAATDLAVELLYLVEAKSAAMDMTRTLNQRLKVAMASLEEKANTDTLTGLKNRRALDGAVGKLLKARRPFALMQIDLDHFKYVNDTHGHAAGDHVLQTVSEIMLDETRACDTCVRTGGDEFVIVFDGLTEAEHIQRVADRLIKRLEAPIDFNGIACRISASAGTVITVQQERRDIADLLRDSDLALYASKHAGRGRHMFFAPDMAA